MPYYRHHMYKGAYDHLYHRNICIQHCVREIVHSDYPGKEKAKVNIYYGRKTITLLAMY
jgi:hypothetical protein